MALIMLGGGVTDIRGSIAGVTYSRAGAGNYARAKTKPVNPRSSLQTTRRANAAYIAKFWSHELSDQHRIDWRDYAANTVWKNKLGQVIQVNGLAAFLRLNALHRMIPSTLVENAPTAYGHGGGVTLSFTADTTLQVINLAEPGGAFDKDVELQNMWLFQGIPSEVGRLCLPKAWRYLRRIWGSAGTPLSFPIAIDTGYTMVAGQRVHLKAIWHDEDYRVSGPWYGEAIAAPL